MKFTAKNVIHEDHTISELNAETKFPNPPMGIGREVELINITCPICKQEINYYWVGDSNSESEKDV